MSKQMRNLGAKKALSLLHNDSLKWQCIKNDNDAFYSEDASIHVKTWLALGDVCVLLDEKNNSRSFTVFNKLFEEDYKKATELFDKIKRKVIQQ